MFSMVTIVNNYTVYLKVTKRVVSKVTIIRKKIFITTYTDVNQIYCSEHFTMYTNTESLCKPKKITCNVACQLYLSLRRCC